LGQVTFALSPLKEKVLALSRKVLLADDSVTAQNMGRRILVDAGYEVITVNNGSSALKKVTESKPDLIVLDVYMPGYGGLEVCQRIRESQETARIPILLTVGKLEPFKAEEARRVRADAFIVKPFEASELLTALTKLEDKIVPQLGGRKSGRSSSASDDAAYAKEFGDIENGWKNRLKIPPPHHPRVSEAAPAPASGAHPESPADERATSKAQPQAPFNAPPDTKLDEPVRMVQTKEGQPQAKPEASEFPVRAEASANEGACAAASETNDEGAFPQFTPRFESEPTHAETVAPEASTKDARPEQAKDHQDEVAAALASLVPSSEQGGEAPASEPEPLPVTMAVAGGGFSGPRWVAQEVVLREDESSLVLEQEMHKAFAAFAAADAARMSLPSSPEQSVSRSSVAPGEVASGTSERSESHFEARASFGDAGDNEEIPQAPSAVTESVLIEPTPSRAAEETKEVAAYAAAASAGMSGGTSENTVETLAASQPFTNAPESSTHTESRYDSELAAAWASWKQVRDSVASPEFTSQIADTAATGFKEIRQDEPAAKAEPEITAAPAEETGAIASIVDSVLAELKPKLMEEISKKIKKQK
jgi:CheY-like chemotaxis protein